MHSVRHRVGATTAMELAAEMVFLTASLGQLISDLPSVNYRPHCIGKTCPCAFPTHQTISPLRTGVVFPSCLAPSFKHSARLSED